MANNHFVSTLSVEVEGKPLAAGIASLLTYAFVDDNNNLPDRFVLRFRDPQRTVLATAGFVIGAKVKLRVQTSDSSSPRPLMSGEVTAVELEIDRTGSVAEVRGLDHSHRLFRGRRVAAYPNMMVADIVRKVTERAGLTVGQIDSPPGLKTDQHSQISQDNVSDWEFLCRLADLVGAQAVVTDGKLDFTLPTLPDDAPSQSAKANQDPFVLEAGSNVISLRAGVTAAEQVPEVIGRGWDHQGKRAIEASVTPKLAEIQVKEVDPIALANKFGSPAFVVADPALSNDGEVRAAANAVAAQISSASVEIEGVARGNPQLRAGASVTLASVGAPFQGQYTLTGTRHLFSAQDGYTTAFTVSGRQERSFYGLASGASKSSERPWSGLVPGIVSDIKDPLKLGRIKVTFPWLDKDFTSGWARLTQLGAGNGRGLLILPEVGDEVLLGFAHGDLDTPFVLGGLYNDSDKPPLSAVDEASGEVKVRALVSRTGHRLEIAEDDGILLSTKDGKFSLKLDQKSNIVEIVSDGKVSLKAKSGMQIDAGTGSLELKGRSVSVDAQQSLSLSGTQSVDVKGMAVKVEGKTSAELTASGTVTVRGAMVKIN